MAEKKKKKEQAPSIKPVQFPGTTSPVSLPVGATGPGLPSGINPLIAGSLNTPYWQQQLKQNPSSVLAAYSPPALNQLSQFYSGQNLGGSSSMANPMGTFMPAPQGLQPIAPGVPPGQTTGSPQGMYMSPPQGLQPAGNMGPGGSAGQGGAVPEPLTPPPQGLQPAGQGGKGMPGGGVGGAPGLQNFRQQAMGSKGQQGIGAGGGGFAPQMPPSMGPQGSMPAGFSNMI